MRKLMHKITGVALAATAFPVFAAVPSPTVGNIPEPGALSLLGIGAVAGLVVWSRNRKNKK